jgi:glycosyltransferase involved in cell wall biosynthesis
VLISVIIPTKDNAKLLEKCLSSLANQNFRDFEVIVVDGHSTDATPEIAKKYGAKHVYEDFGTRGGACNVGAEHAKGKILVFTDDDCTFPTDWLKKINAAFEDKDLAVFGGDDIIDEKKASYFERTLFQIDKSKGIPKHPQKRLRGCNTSYRKSIFSSEKGFNPKLRGIEDTELHHRLAKKDYKMKFDPGLYVYHKRRSNFLALFKRMFTNGMSRVQLVKHYRELLSFMDVAPPLAIIFTIVLLCLSVFNLVYFWIWLGLGIVYFVAKSLFIAARARGFRYLPLLPLVLLVREFSFGLGILCGIGKYSK